LAQHSDRRDYVGGPSKSDGDLREKSEREKRKERGG
jgi:hypothetical protein